MVVLRSVSRPLAVLVFALAIGVGSAHAQPPQAGQQYQPQVGQAGKDVVWVPTPDTLVEKMLDLANVTAQDYVIDLGSGDGRTVVAAAMRGARAHGIEYNPEMVTVSRANAEKAGLSARATFAVADLFETDLSQATVITMFLLPQINLKLRPTILQLAPGTRIVSNSFDMGDWTADEQATIQDDCVSWCTAMLWIVPARVDGVWRLGSGQLVLTQSFQVVSGAIEIDGRPVPISDGRLRGAEIAFMAAGAQYAGRVNGDTIEGTIKSGTDERRWKATRSEQR